MRFQKPRRLLRNSACYIPVVEKTLAESKWLPMLSLHPTEARNGHTSDLPLSLLPIN